MGGETGKLQNKNGVNTNQWNYHIEQQINYKTKKIEIGHTWKNQRWSQKIEKELKLECQTRKGKTITFVFNSLSTKGRIKNKIDVFQK